jgi:hypothetical protein
LRAFVRALGRTALLRSHRIRPLSFGDVAPDTTTVPDRLRRTLIRTIEYIRTVSVCEPRPSATARTRVVSETGSESENEPPAPVVTVRVSERRAVAVIATVTPARAGVTVPVSLARPLPVRLRSALRSIAVVVTGPVGVPPGGGPAEQEPTT